MLVVAGGLFSYFFNYFKQLFYLGCAGACCGWRASLAVEYGLSS